SWIDLRSIPRAEDRAVGYCSRTARGFIRDPLILRLRSWLINVRLRHPAEPLGHLPRLAEGAEDVASKDLVDVGLGITPLQQLLGEPGVAGDVLQAGGPGGDAVEVGAEADVVDPCGPDDVVDVVGDVGHGPAGQRVALEPGGERAGVGGRVAVLGPQLLAGG